MYCSGMKVLPVSLGINIYKNNANNKPLEQRQSFATKNSYLSQGVTFTGFKGEIPSKYINTLAGFKNLARNGHLGCVWCGKSMLHTEEMSYFVKYLNNCSKNGNDFSRIMQHLQDYFPPKSDFLKFSKKLNAYNVAYPQLSVKQLIFKMQPEAEKNLINKQIFVFQKLNKLSEKLPEAQQQAFKNLLENSKKRILHIPYVSEYSAKEFVYQLNTLTRNLKNNPVKHKMELISSFLMCDTLAVLKQGKCPQKFIENLSNQTELSQDARDILLSLPYPEWLTQAKLLLLSKIGRLAREVHRPDIKKLCATTKDKVLGVPTTVQFSNKAFVYKLNEILDDANNEPLRMEFNKVAENLPSSLDNMDAFIVKHKYASEEEILNDVLKYLQVTLEHTVPILRHTKASSLKEQVDGLRGFQRTIKGKNELANWSLAHSWCNSFHGSKNIKGENFPFDKDAGVAYFNTLIKDANSGRFAGETIIQMAKNYFIETGIKINLKGLKYTPAELPPPEY